jgi:hypothetical protein
VRAESRLDVRREVGRDDADQERSQNRLAAIQRLSLNRTRWLSRGRSKRSFDARPTGPGGSFYGQFTRRREQAGPFWASISQSGKQIILTNDVGDTSPASIDSSGNVIVATKWGVRGNVADNCNRIAWSNGSVWYRGNGGVNTTTSGWNLSGKWTGYWTNNPKKLLPASISQSGKQIILTNDVGDTSPASIDSSGNVIVATKWGVRGNVTNNGNRITWSNGSVWERQP